MEIFFTIVGLVLVGMAVYGFILQSRSGTTPRSSDSGGDGGWFGHGHGHHDGGGHDCGGHGNGGGVMVMAEEVTAMAEGVTDIPNAA